MPLSNTARGLELTLKLHAPFSRIFGRHRWSRIGQQKFGAQSVSEEHLWLIKQHKISKNKSYFLNEVRCLLTFCCTVDATVDRVSMACIISILFFCFLFFASIIQSKVNCFLGPNPEIYSIAYQRKVFNRFRSRMFGFCQWFCSVD